MRVERLSPPQLTRGRGVDYAALWEHPPYAPTGRKVRIRIHRDFYDGQSYARAELFDGNKWNVIETLPTSEMMIHVLKDGPRGHRIPAVSSQTPERDLESVRSYFEDDEAALLKRVALILV